MLVKSILADPPLPTVTVAIGIYVLAIMPP
jgi:hypothetical protein